MAISSTAASAMPLKLPKAPELEFDPPKGERVAFKNGMVVYLLKDPSLPAIRVTSFIRSGDINDPAGKAGLGMLTAGMLEDGGSASYTAEKVDETLEYLGASISSVMDTEMGSFAFFALKKDLSKVLDIYADLLMRPAFSEDKFEILRKSMLEGIRRRNDNPGRSVSREAVRHYFGIGHPYAWRLEESSVGSITIDDLKAYHDNYYRPNNIVMAVSGNYGSDKEILAKLEDKFGSWEPKEVKFPDIPAPKTIDERRVFFIQKEVPQTFIMVVQKGIKRPDPIEFPFNVTNDVVGAPGLSSRLWDTVRARKGLAYTVYSLYSRRNAHPGYIYAYCGTKPETYSKALEEILRQLKLARTEPLSEKELADAKGAKVNSFVFRFKTPFDLVSQRALYELWDYPDDYLETYVRNVESITLESAFEAASSLYDPDNAMIFVIGDSKKFDKPLSEFGPVTELKED